MPVDVEIDRSKFEAQKFNTTNEGVKLEGSPRFSRGRVSNLDVFERKEQERVEKESKDYDLERYKKIAGYVDIGNFKIEEVLGKGAEGRVLKVTHKDNKKKFYAIKEIKIENLSPKEIDSIKKTYNTLVDIRLPYVV